MMAVRRPVPRLARAAVALAALAGALGAFGAGRGMLVLQCGSDWCVSGEDVRKVFESHEFKRALGSKFDLAVYDDMENPTAKVKAANEKLENLRVATRRFPAITCLTDEPRRLFAQLENIPFDVTPESLAGMVADAAKIRDEAIECFKHGRGKGQAAADALGRGFELLESQVGEFDRDSLRDGPLAWTEQWNHLQEIDADDRFGWRRRFTMGYGFDLVDEATELAKAGEMEKGEMYIAKLLAIPTNALSVVQRQCLQVAAVAYSLGFSSGGDWSLPEKDSAILHGVLDMGRDTVWGQYALGRLILAGERLDTVPPFRATVRKRPAKSKTIVTPFKLREVEERIAALKPRDEGFTEAEKRTLALYAVLRRIGRDGWDSLKARPGAARFMRDFFTDREWMEDFAWSGRCSDWKNAILALESLCFQDGGAWIEKRAEGRRFATATALEKPDANEAWLADWLDAYRGTALSNRLHKTAYEQPVWRWRYAIRQIHCPRTEDPANQQRFLDSFYNVSAARFGSAHCTVPYRPYNCFGDNIHGPRYFKPWEAAGEWPRRRYSYIVGGVCGELSTFGSCCSNAHGLPSIPVGQPGHCAYTRRLPDGEWVVDNFISTPTGFTALWPSATHWTYTFATEITFEGDRERRLEADRFLEIAHVAEVAGKKPDTVSRIYRRACNSWPKHYTAWREYGDWLRRASRPLAEHGTYARATIKGLEGLRHPLWDLLTPYFRRVANEAGPQALYDALAEFAPLLRQGDELLQDNGDFSVVVKDWTRPLASEPELMEKSIADFAAAQYGTKTYFTQVLGWGAPFLFADEKRADRFLKLLPKMAEKFSQSMRGVKGGAKAVADAKSTRPNLGPFLLSAEESGDVAAFQQFAAIQRRIGRQPAGLDYKERDFNGQIVSGEGMLTLFGSAPGDTPEQHPRTIDASKATDFTFCALGYKQEPAAMVTLAGPCELRGIVISLVCPDKKRSASQLPIEVEISEDRSSWAKVFETDRLKSEYRIEFKSGKYPRARYIRVRRLAGKDGKLEQLEYFQMSKILAYGKKLY